MPSILNEVGWFQFENLIKNRVPFLLINLGVDMSKIYQGFYQTHLEAQIVQVEAKNALKEIQSKKLPPHHAILVVCQDGVVSAQLIDELESAGFMNVFYAKGGLQNLLNERTNVG